MNVAKIVGIVLLVCGTLSLVYGGFSYTKDESQIDLGPVSVQVQERERVNLPIWLGVGLIVIGGGLLVGGGKEGVRCAHGTTSSLILPTDTSPATAGLSYRGNLLHPSPLLRRGALRGPR